MPSMSYRIKPVGFAAVLLISSSVASLAHADVVTGTLTPAGAKATVVDASGKTVAEIKSGAYQLQLPPGKYKAQCQAPKQKQQDLLVLSEPVTVNIDCS